ncbi:MAG: hypothetical protein HZB39_13240 [Planctomycetes bacterium]|nr:hypothetical protein [Planctomycetota bacterium]
MIRPSLARVPNRVRLVPPDPAAVRAALAAPPRARPRWTARALVPLAALAFGIAFALPSAPEATDANAAETTDSAAAPAPKEAAPPRVGRRTIRANAELVRDPDGGKARRAAIELDVVWEGSDFDAGLAEQALTTWLATLTSRELIESASGADDRPSELLRTALGAGEDAMLVRVAWRRLELR